LGAAAFGAAALPALAFHGWSAIAVGERVASVLVAGLAAWAAARRARRSAPSLAGGAAVLAAAWLLSQAGGPLALLVALVLGLGIGLSSPEPAPLIWASAGLAAATGAALVGLGATTRPAVALWAGAALVVVAGWGGLAARLRDGFRPRRVNLALASTISAATVFVTLMVGATSAEATWFGSPVSHGPRQGGEVALTFDTSSAAATAAVARVLAAQGAPATFFTSAWDVLADPSVARDILGWKQVVGSAMYDRSPMSALAPWRHQAERAQRVFRRRAGVCPAFLMPPHGEHTPFMARAARRRGMLMVTWDVAVDPAQEKDAADVAERVLGRARSGSIIRIDLTRGGPATAPTVAAALPAVLRGLRARGLTPAPLYTLLHHPAYVAHC
jgi:peptidoglycan/xylan/chitin deacetylase (PgdA/CDA1 family)